MIYTRLRRNAPRCYFWRVLLTQTALEQFSKMLLLGPFTGFTERNQQFSLCWKKITRQDEKNLYGCKSRAYHVNKIPSLVQWPCPEKKQDHGESTTGISQYLCEFLKILSSRCNMLTLLHTEYTGNCEADTVMCAYTD